MELEVRELDQVVALRDPDRVAELPDRPRGIAAAAHRRDRRHARVVPARDVALLDEALQGPLARDHVADVQAREFDLARPTRHVAVLDHPVVERAVVEELEGAERVGHLLERIGERMREVVHRIDAPGVARSVVGLVLDPVEDRIPHRDDRRRHVDAGPQHAAAFRELPRPHARKEIEIFLDLPVAKGTLAAGFGQRALVRADRFSRLIVDECLLLADQVDGEAVERFEVVGGVVEMPLPIEAEPADVGHDAVDVLRLLGRRIRVVEAEMTAAVRDLLCEAEVEADGLRVADVEIAVRLGWKARDDRRMLPGRDVVGDDRANEIQAPAADLSPGISRHGFPRPLF